MEIFDLPVAIMSTISGLLCLWYNPRHEREIRRRMEKNQISEIEGNKSIRIFRIISIVMPILGAGLLIESLIP
jgi:uncharacterized membrane protein